MTSTRFGLKDDTIEKIREVFASHPQVDKAVIFGSRAKVIQKNGSDIDLTMHGKELTLNILYKIMEDMDELLLPYAIDLSIFHELSDPDFIDHIQRVGITFYEKK